MEGAQDEKRRGERAVRVAAAEADVVVAEAAVEAEAEATQAELLKARAFGPPSQLSEPPSCCLRGSFVR